MQRSQAVDILKWWAIAAVILIHYITSSAITPGSPEALRWIALNQLLRYCVPIFVALSGYALANKYQDSVLSLKEFYQRRVFKLLPLYVLWSVVIYFIVHMAPGWDGWVGSMPLWQSILLGRTDYQLYFVPLIFQLYVLFPVILTFWKKYPWWTLLGSFVVQLGTFAGMIYIYDTHAQFPFFRSDQEQYIFFGSWVFYFVLGMNFVKLSTFPVILKKLLAPVAWVATLTGLAWAITEGHAMYASGVDIISSTRFTRYSILPFATGSIILGFLSDPLWQKFPGWINKIQVYLGQKSYLIYLSHTLWLRIITSAVNHNQTPKVLLTATGITIAATLLSEYLDRARSKPVATSAQIK